MNWEELLKTLQEQADEQGKLPEFMDEKVVVHIGDDLTELTIVQDLQTGRLMLVPVFN